MLHIALTGIKLLRVVL